MFDFLGNYYLEVMYGVLYVQAFVFIIQQGHFMADFRSRMNIIDLYEADRHRQETSRIHSRSYYLFATRDLGMNMTEPS